MAGHNRPLDSAFCILHSAFCILHSAFVPPGALCSKPGGMGAVWGRCGVGLGALPCKSRNYQIMRNLQRRLSLLPRSERSSLSPCSDFPGRPFPGGNITCSRTAPFRVGQRGELQHAGVKHDSQDRGWLGAKRVRAVWFPQNGRLPPRSCAAPCFVSKRRQGRARAST